MFILGLLVRFRRGVLREDRHEQHLEKARQSPDLYMPVGQVIAGHAWIDRTCR